MHDDDLPLDRQKLYDEVWSDPVSIVAQRYGLSDVGLAKICRKLRIPLPGRGYWAKVKVGNKVYRTPLPKVTEGQLLRIDIAKISLSEIKTRSLAKQKTVEIKEAIGQLVVPNELISPHQLIKATSKRLKRRDGWTDEKGLRSAPAEVLHLEVTRTALDRALLITDTLLKHLAKQSITVRIDAQRKRTIMNVDGIDVELKVSEHVKRTLHIETAIEIRARERYWSRLNRDFTASYPHIPRFDYHPTGELTITVGHWPSHSWKDTPRTPLEMRLGTVVAGTISLAMDIRAKEIEEERRREKLRLAEERYAFMVQQMENEKQLLQKLEEDAADWERASRLRAYINAVKNNAVSEDRLSEDLMKWIIWAQAKADWLDPLVHVSDLILDAPYPKKPSYYY